MTLSQTFELEPISGVPAALCLEKLQGLFGADPHKAIEVFKLWWPGIDKAGAELVLCDLVPCVKVGFKLVVTFKELPFGLGRDALPVKQYERIQSREHRSTSQSGD
mgnify:CR=1 FL=1